ncbi:MAG: acetyl-CoA carboxylase biotin carboxylase subunit [Pseudomonadota bacterium]
MFSRILIANRGEIAFRVIRTAKRLGIETVAVYSEADAQALHARMADYAVCVGPAAASQSYLVATEILRVACETGAEAVHPGYGFLSENAAFARACADAGIVFIGPGADAIDAMGSKAQAKSIMADAGVPLIPGYHGDDQSDGVLRAAADEMGYPVLLKATAGGGGKGMRAVDSAEGFEEALAAARREATASFGDDRMLVEKLLQGPRHVEVQVFCDAHGGGVYLAERDCSIQRRHQKVIEEAPAPGLTPELRKAMGEAAVDAAKAIDYRGAGTVEFLLDQSGAFYFMEMNTRLQVEHPVTEMITGQDLVEWQLLVAAGVPLPLEQSQIKISGHAMEARIYAEDPEEDFLPSTGTIACLREPECSSAVRIDTGVEEGSEISPFYDPMIAKLIVHGRDRKDARLRLVSALDAYGVGGLRNNVGFLRRISASAGFRDADLDTSFIERHQGALALSAEESHEDLAAACAVHLHLRAAGDRPSGNDTHSPWAATGAFRINLPSREQLRLAMNGRDVTASVVTNTDSVTVFANGEETEVSGAVSNGVALLAIGSRRLTYTVALHESGLTLFRDGRSLDVSVETLRVEGVAAAAGDTGFTAPMHGTVVAHLVEPGAPVEAGDGVIVIEAMKMEQTLRAPSAGKVLAFNASPGDLVDRGSALVSFEAADS